MRWLTRILGALSVLVVFAIAIFAMLPAERIARLAADQFQRLTGRALVIEGDVSPSFWPVLGIRTGPVRIANADWSDLEAPMLRAEGLVVEINASALLGGEIRILGLEADRPELLLERAKDGRANWVFGGGGSGGEIGPETPGVGRSYTLERGLIRGGVIRYVDHASGQDLRLDAVDLDLAIPDHAGAFTVGAAGLLGGQRISLALRADSYATFTEGRMVPLTLTASAGKANLVFDGRGGWDPMAAEGSLTADLSDIAALAALAGSGNPGAIPEGFGARQLALSGNLVLQGGTASLSEATVTADDNVLRGTLALAQGEARPKLTAQLGAGALRFAASAAQGGTGGGVAQTGVAQTGWPKELMDVSALGVMDAAVALVAGSVDLGKVKLGETRLTMTIDRARAVFSIGNIAAYGGAVTGEFVVNGRGGLSVGGDLTLANIQMQPLLQDFMGWSRLISTGNLSLKFLGVGNSLDAIMQGLKGEGQLTLGKGELVGLDIAGMLRSLDTSYMGDGQKTIFDGISASFSILEGQLNNNDLRLMAPYLTATGAGRIGLGPRDLDYRIRPTAFPGADGSGGVMGPLRITGPWADPTFRLDLEALAREKMEAEAKAAEERLKAEAAAAEARAKAELEARLQEELGVTRNDGESLEEAAKRRAREALGNEGARLLEGLLGNN